MLISLIDPHMSMSKAEEHLDELEALSQTLGFTVKARFFQRRATKHPRTLIGKGKLEEIKAFVIEQDIGTVVFDDELSPTHLRNLENLLKVAIYDRSLLILDIFLQHAQSARAQWQVQLARYVYLLPRLTRRWAHLERQRGRLSTRAGAGEKEIETDRRQIQHRILVLRKRLQKIEVQSATQRKRRAGMVRIALIGYTNAGKSTWMNLLAKEKVYAAHHLFATLDTTVRKVSVHQVPFLLSDTVGFIRKLPHGLIESFKSSLAEVREADILLHVVDVAHESHEEHIRVVQETLAELQAVDKSMILLCNKMDLLPSAEQSVLQENIGVLMENMHIHAQLCYASAHDKKSLARLRQCLHEAAQAQYKKCAMPYTMAP